MSNRDRFLATGARFSARLAEWGATLLQPYAGFHTPHYALCAAGHDCRPRPSLVLSGSNPCAKCEIAGRKRNSRSVGAEAAFRLRLEQLGAELLEPEWLGSMRPHRMRCAEGHECQPIPATVVYGHGICRTCVGNDSAAAEVAFRDRLKELGAELLEPRWLGKDRPHRARCANGHDCWPQPGNVRAGVGICRICKYKNWDVFYVVTHGSEPRVKFGITSGDPRPRLGDHRRHGYSGVEYLVIGLPGRVALDTENAVRSALTLAGERPVKGREYFDISCLPLVLDVARGWLANQEKEAS